MHIRPCIDSKEQLAKKVLRKRIKEDLVDDAILDATYWKHSQNIIRLGNLDDEDSDIDTLGDDSVAHYCSHSTPSCSDKST